MVDETDREFAYQMLFEEVKLLKTTIDRDIYDAHELELLVRVNALTEAYLREAVTLLHAKKLLREYLDWLKAPPPPAAPPEEPVREGDIKF